MSKNCYLLTWQPDAYEWGSLESDINDVAMGNPTTVDYWNAGHRKSAKVGDRFFLLKQGREPRGIMASGEVTSDVFQLPHWDEQKAAQGLKANYVGIRFDRLIDPDQVLPFHRLPLKYSPMASGQRVRPELVDEIQRRWDEHVPPRLPLAGISGDLVETPNTFVEGEVQVTHATRYERNPKARLACIAAHGTSCMVCGMSFGEVYGPLGEGFIHIHHKDPLSDGGKREVDPVRDLVPVCANCHAMLHRRDPPLSVEELQRALAPRKQRARAR